MIALALRLTGVARALGLLEYIRFDLPRTTTALGATLLLGLVAVSVFWSSGHFLVSDEPWWLTALFAFTAALAVAAMAAMTSSRRNHLGWTLGSVAALVVLAVYVISRSAGLPGMAELEGWWDYPLGTVSMALAAGFVGVHASVLLDVNTAVPDARDWHD